MRFGKAVRMALLFELFWKLLILGLVNPLFREIYHTYAASVGLRFNQNMLGVFLNWKGAALFLLLFFGAALLIFYEYAVIINIVALYRQGNAFSLPQVMKSSVWNLGVMRGWSLAAGSLYYVLLLPLTRLGYVNTMAPQVVIPEFVFGEMRKTSLGVAGIVAVFVAEYAIHLALLFVPVCMVLRGQRFAAASRESLGCWKKLDWKHRLMVLGILLLWERTLTEISRYWRRKPLGNDDFGEYFLKNLLHTEAFRTDLLYWLFLNLLTAAAMTGIIWLLVASLEGKAALRASFNPPWSRDGEMLVEMAEHRWARAKRRWKARLQTRRWQSGLAAAGLLLAAWLVAASWQQPMVHRPLAIGHRGSIEGVENTLPAILAAQALGMDYAEIDVQLTRDGVPVLFHDGNLRRLAGREEEVGGLDWAQLGEIPISDYGHPDADARIVSLEEVLRALQDGAMGLLIELKPAGSNHSLLAEAVIELVERYGFGERAMFMSLDYMCLMPLLDRHPEWWVGYCLFGASGDIDEAVWRYGVDFLAVEEALVNSRLILQAREQYLPVYVWSVYDNEKMRQYLEMGVGGIISDYPEELRTVLDTYLAAHPYQDTIWQEEGFPLRGKEKKSPLP